VGNSEARALLLDDTIVPTGLTVEEEREACRALKGSMLRQEVYAADGTTRTPHPYKVTEQNFSVTLLQPQGGNPYAVFLTHARETLEYQYERNPSDPRVAHAMTLAVDAFGNILASAAIGYGRRHDLDWCAPTGRQFYSPGAAAAMCCFDRARKGNITLVLRRITLERLSYPSASAMSAPTAKATVTSRCSLCTDRDSIYAP
jgi:hypothetical protein